MWLIYESRSLPHWCSLVLWCRMVVSSFSVSEWQSIGSQKRTSWLGGKRGKQPTKLKKKGFNKTGNEQKDIHRYFVKRSNVQIISFFTKYITSSFINIFTYIFITGYVRFIFINSSRISAKRRIVHINSSFSRRGRRASKHLRYVNKETMQTYSTSTFWTTDPKASVIWQHDLWPLCHTSLLRGVMCGTQI